MTQADWQLVDLIAEHAKECDSDYCSACECGWMGPDTSDSGHEDHAEHLAIVIKIAGYARRDRQPATETPHAPAETEEP